MFKHANPSGFTHEKWQKAAEFALTGDPGWENRMGERVVEILAGLLVSEQTVVEAKQAIIEAIQKEMSRVGSAKRLRTFNVMFLTQAAQLTETPDEEPNRMAPLPHPKGWGFFLTEKTVKKTGASSEMDHVVISVHLYHEGDPA
jgi:hypothetical protein